MRQLLIIMMFTLALVVGCTQTTNEQSTELIGNEPGQEDIGVLPEATLSADLQQAILEFVGEQQNLPPDQLQITATEAADWPDACLGIAAPDELCAQVLTPGWAVSVTDGQQTWNYRTNLEATQIKLANTE